MKKSLLLAAFSLAFAFNTGQIYTCNTLGISFKDNNKTYNIPNNEKTADELKKTLKELYSIKIKPQNGKITVFVADKNDTLDYVRKLDNNVSLYKTKASDLFMLTDPKTDQMGINIPSQQMIIYYQCK